VVPAVRKVVVVGCGGSGKTVVSRALGARLGLPVVHLDDVYYDESWDPLPREQFEAAQKEITSRPAWVIDGNHMSSMPIRLAAADTVVIMDVPTVVALWGVLQRWWKHRSGQHGEGVYVRVTADFVRYVVLFRRRMRPRVMAAVREHAPHATVWRLRSRGAARRMLQAVPVNVRAVREDAGG
jgi:adenylate kinase family enzyme